MRKSKIGGQAVIEGVMMRGATSGALSVRDEKKRIRIKTWRLKTNPNSIWKKIPIVRGVINFASSMYEGVGTLMSATEVFGEEEPTKFEKWMMEKLKIDLMSAVMFVAVLLGLGLAVGLFIVVPSLSSKWIVNIAHIESNTWRTVIEAVIKVSVLFLYIYLTSLLGDIKRVYMYHGAEHKTINCYENEMELTVENVAKCKKFHNRCGTTFMFFVVLMGIFLFSFIQIDNEFYRILAKIALLPITAGLAYELLMAVAKTECFLVFPLKIPGILLQKITTKEPTDDMIEVAIMSFKAVLELDADPNMATYDRLTFKYLIDATREGKKLLDKAKIDYDADIEWAEAHVLGMKRSQLTDYTEITKAQYDEIMDIIRERASGKPLWHIIGNVDFYGYNLKCDGRALIPRPETEELVLKVKELSSEKNTALDLCTGSGAIAIAVAKETGMKLTAVDLSSDALSLAKENATLNNVDIEFIKSNMFDELNGMKFDIIMSNPPYIKKTDIETLQKEVKEYEPMMALDGGDDGLDFYRIIANNAKSHLNEGGFVIMEIGYDQGEDVATIFSEYSNVEVIKDFNGMDRIIIGRA